MLRNTLLRNTTKRPLSAPSRCLLARHNANINVPRAGARRIATGKKAPAPPGPSPRSNPGHGKNPLEDPANDLGGPGGQELYPASGALQRKYATVTAAGVMLSGAIMYISKRLEWGADPNVVHVLVRDMSKGEIDDVKMIPVRVPVVVQAKSGSAPVLE